MSYEVMTYELPPEQNASTEHSPSQGDPVGNKKFMYPEHLTPAALQSGIKSGRLRSGKFMASRENYLEGFVCLGDNEDEADRVLVQGLMNLNR